MANTAKTQTKTRGRHHWLQMAYGLHTASLGPPVGRAPDLRQADGGMEPVEDDERDAQVADDAPWQVPEELKVQREVDLRLLHLTRYYIF